MDYKTGRAQSQEDSDESLQLSIYAMAAREKWGYHADRLVLYNLEGNSAVVTRRSDVELEAAKSGCRKFRKTSPPGNFNPRPAIIADSAPIAICAPPPRSHCRNTRRKTRPPPRGKQLNDFRRAKNLGDASASPVCCFAELL